MLVRNDERGNAWEPKGRDGSAVRAAEPATSD